MEKALSRHQFHPSAQRPVNIRDRIKMVQFGFYQFQSGIQNILLANVDRADNRQNEELNRIEVSFVF